MRKLEGFGEKWDTDGKVEILGTVEMNYSKWKKCQVEVYPEMGNFEWNVLEHECLEYEMCQEMSRKIKDCCLKSRSCIWKKILYKKCAF